MSTKIINFFVLCIIFEMYVIHSTVLATSDLLKYHFPSTSTLDNGQGEGNLDRFTELDFLIMCGIFRGRMIQEENPDKVKHLQQLAEMNLIAAIEEATRIFNLQMKNNEPFFNMEIEDTGLSKSLYHCPQLDWKTQSGMESMNDFYITVSDVEENVPLCFKKIDENKVEFVAVEDKITLDKIPDIIKDLEELFGNEQLKQAGIDYNKEGYSHNANYGGIGLESSVPVTVTA